MKVRRRPSASSGSSCPRRPLDFPLPHRQGGDLEVTHGQAETIRQPTQEVNVIINIDVPDLDSAIRFYTEALGLSHTRTLDGDTAELRGANAMFYLLLKPAGSTAVRSPPLPREYQRHWTPVHFDLVVDDVDAAARRAIAAGATQETGHLDWRGSRCLSLSDPFGHGFCFIQFENGTYV